MKNALQYDLFTYAEESKKREDNHHKETKISSLENQKILKRYKMHCQSKGLTEESIKAIIENDLRLFIDYIGEKHIKETNHLDIQDFLLHCTEDRLNGDEAISRKFASLNKFFDTLINQEVLDIKNPLNKLEKPKVRKKQRGYLTPEEYKQILNYLDNSNCMNKARDAALISFMYSSGCRLTEIYQQNKDSLDFASRRFKVLGKGAKERICIFSKDAVDRIQKYLDSRTDDLEPLFLSRQGNRLEKKSIQDAVKNAGRRSGVKKNVHPHLFRHTRAMHLLQAGANLETIQRVLGHENISTTQIYAHMNMDSVQDEVSKLDGDL